MFLRRDRERERGGIRVRERVREREFSTELRWKHGVG